MYGRRLLCAGVDQVEWERFPIPEQLLPQEILIRSRVSLISAGTEMAVYTGTHIGYQSADVPSWLRYPVALGYALVGTVQAVGEAVTDWKPGDLVVAHAPHGDWAICDEKTLLLERVPPQVTPEQAAMACLAGFSMVAIRNASIALGESVVVIGLGLIGQFAAQLASLSGARPTIGMDLIPSRRRTAEGFGITSIDGQDVVRSLPAILPGGQANVVIEATGNSELVPLALDLCRNGGRVVLLGSLRGPVTFDAYASVHKRGIRLLGAHVDISDHSSTINDPWTRSRNLEVILGLFADDSLKSDGLINTRVKPDDVPEIYRTLSTDPQKPLGVVIDWES